ncbi:tetratricopeptide repeat protein [Singulisphaera sp. PoT]|uniref:tetratricopeptide repeat protein n=1 Tax=Singulisphaera sp. PoT TaxID=3411797 RepID=UPI003BF49ED3
MRRGHGRIANATWAMALVCVCFAGCSQLGASRPKEHASAKLLDSGDMPKITKRQKADVQVALGRSLEESKNTASAAAAYAEAIKNDPKRADAEARLAVLLDKSGKAEEAKSHFARALQLAPKDPDILCDQGYSFYLQRRWGEAERNFRHAIEVQPKHARSHTNLGLVLACQGNSAEALAEFQRAGCDKADAQANLGLVLAIEGRYAEAKQAYSVAIATKPKSDIAAEGLRATTLAMSGDASKPSEATRAIAQSKSIVDTAIQRTSIELQALPPSR